MDRPRTVPARRVRMRDVAAHAGVSLATVSNTLNHPERVSPEKLVLVRAAIAELGFVPNAPARMLMGASNNTLGLVVPSVLSPFFMELAHAIGQAAQEAGHLLLVCNSENDRGKERALLQMLAAQRARGVLLSPAGGGDPHVEAVHGLPVVYLDYATDSERCSVSVDHVAGGRMAAEHLLSLGVETVAFVGGRPWMQQFDLRARGMRQALREAGREDGDQLVEVHEIGIGVESGRAAARKLLETGLPEGICCGNDMLAFGVFRELRQAGVRIPEDVMLVGYDDVEFAESWVVPLTSVRQPSRRMGQLAAELLLQHASNPQHEHRQTTLLPELVVRDTSSPVSS